MSWSLLTTCGNRATSLLHNNASWRKDAPRTNAQTTIKISIVG